MASFLARQRLQCLMPLLNAAALHMLDQDMCGWISLLLQSHTALESSVAFIFHLSLNDEWWLQNQVLNLVSQSPKWCHVGILEAAMEALEMIDLVWHLLLSGHSNFVLQLCGILLV